LKKLFSYLGYTLLVFVMVTLSVLNSSQIISALADRYAPKYDIQYESLSGGLLSGLRIKSLSYKGLLLFDSFDLRWNPTLLLDKRIQISSISVTGVDTANIRLLIDAQNDAAAEEAPQKSSGTFPFDLGLGRVHLSLKPFTENNVSVDAAILDVHHLLYSSEKFAVDGMELELNTSLANLTVAGGLQERRVFLSGVSLSRIDVDSLLRLIGQSGNNNSSDTGDTPAADSEPSTLIPTEIFLKRITVASLPFRYEGVGVNKLFLKSKALRIDLNRIEHAQQGAVTLESIDMDIDSNLTNISMRASLDEENASIEKLSVDKIDTDILRKLAASFESNETADDNATQNHDVNGSDTPPSPFIPKNIFVKGFKGSILPTLYDGIDIYRLKLNGDDLSYAPADNLLHKGNLDIDFLSSYAGLDHRASIRDNHITSKGTVELLSGLFEAYDIPLHGGAVKPIAITLDGSTKELNATIAAKASKLLKADKGEFNIEELETLHKINYDLETGRLDARSHITALTPYTKPLALEHNLTLVDQNLTHQGVLSVDRIEGIEGNFTKPLDHLSIRFLGDMHSIRADIDSDGLKGDFRSKDLKKADLNIETRNALLLRDFVSLPHELQEAKASVALKLPLDLQKPLPLTIKPTIRSNIADIDAKVSYDKNLSITATTKFPKNSLLRNYDKALNIDALTPLKSDVRLGDKEVYVALKAPKLDSKITFNPENNDTTGDLTLAGAKFRFSGNARETITLDNTIGSLAALLKQLSTIYAFDAPPLDGDARIAVELRKLKELTLKLNSNKLSFKADRKTTHVFGDTMVELKFADSVLTLERYATTFQKQKFFASRPSVVSIKEGNVEISPLWLNDQLKVTGLYNIESKKGKIEAYADPFEISHELIDLKTLIDITTDIDGLKNTVKGKITLLGGDIHYDMDTKSFASDSDIIIVQDIKPKSDNPAVQNLSASILIDTRQPLVYKNNEMYIEAKPNLTLLKEPYGPMLVLGSVELGKGSYYRLKNKKFKLKKSMINFTGDPAKPLLDIVAYYKTHNYDIKIMVTGTPSMPNIQFSSKPYLSKEQILSVLLFDTDEAADMHSSDDMMRLMGGAIAKSALSNIGIKLDHLTIGADGSMEVGKKLSKKLMIIYVNDKVSSVKLKYDITKKIEADVTVNAVSTSGDIFYKREF